MFWNIFSRYGILKINGIFDCKLKSKEWYLRYIVYMFI